jgi:hypothetical protein
MSAHSAERRLVKSSPELWAGVSDQESLGRYLHAFGEIRITGTDPETTVAWEGDQVSGTVEIASAGWGTKVTLTVEVEDRPAVATPPVPAPEPEVIKPELIVMAAPPAPPVIAASVPAAPEAEAKPVPEAKPKPTPVPAPTRAAPVKRGFLARLLDFGPPIPDPPRPTVISAEPTPVPEPGLTAEPEPDPEPTPQPVAEPEPMPDPIVVPEVEPEVSTEAPEPAPMSAESINEILSGVLDDLGAAHHRPFSRS